MSRTAIRCNCGQRISQKEVMQTGYYPRPFGPSLVFVRFRCSRCKKLGEQYVKQEEWENGILKDATVEANDTREISVQVNIGTGSGNLFGVVDSQQNFAPDVAVLVDDRPGQIARLLTEIGEIGVNLEDLRLDHSSGQNVGMVEISVLPSAHDLLVEALSDRGWRVLQ